MGASCSQQQIDQKFQDELLENQRKAQPPQLEDDYTLKNIQVLSDQDENHKTMLSYDYLSDKMVYTVYQDIQSQNDENIRQQKKNEFLERIKKLEMIENQFKDNSRFQDIAIQMLDSNEKKLEIYFDYAEFDLLDYINVLQAYGTEGKFVDLIQLIYKNGIDLITILKSKGYYYQGLETSKIRFQLIKDDFYAPRFIGFNKITKDLPFNTLISPIKYYNSKIFSKVQQEGFVNEYGIKDFETKFKLEVFALFRIIQEVALAYQGKQDTQIQFNQCNSLDSLSKINQIIKNKFQNSLQSNLIFQEIFKMMEKVILQTDIAAAYTEQELLDLAKKICPNSLNFIQINDPNIRNTLVQYLQQNLRVVSSNQYHFRHQFLSQIYSIPIYLLTEDLALQPNFKVESEEGRSAISHFILDTQHTIFTLLGYDGQGKSTFLFSQYIKYKKMESDEQLCLKEFGRPILSYLLNLCQLKNADSKSIKKFIDDTIMYLQNKQKLSQPVPLIVIFIDGFGEFNSNKVSIPELFQLENPVLNSNIKIIVGCQLNNFFRQKDNKNDLETYLQIKNNASQTIARFIAPITTQDITNYYRDLFYIKQKYYYIFYNLPKPFSQQFFEENTTARPLQKLKTYPIILQYIDKYLCQSHQFFKLEVPANLITTMNVAQQIKCYLQLFIDKKLSEFGMLDEFFYISQDQQSEKINNYYMYLQILLKEMLDQKIYLSLKINSLYLIPKNLPESDDEKIKKLGIHILPFYATPIENQYTFIDDQVKNCVLADNIYKVMEAYCYGNLSRTFAMNFISSFHLSYREHQSLLLMLKKIFDYMVINDYSSYETIVNNLVFILSLSKTAPELEQASSNAFTILNLIGYNFQGMDLSGIKINQADLWGARFYETNFTGATLNNVNFSNAMLNKANFKDAIISNCDIGINYPIFSSGHKEKVTCLALSEAQDKLFSAGNDKNIIEWNIFTGEVAQIFEGHQAPISKLVYCQDKGLLVSASEDGNIQVRNVETKTLQVSIKSQQAGITALDACSDLNLIVSGSSDSSVKIWDLLTGQEIPLDQQAKHQGPITGIKISKGLIITSSTDKFINFISAATKNLIQKIQPSNSFVCDFDISPNNKLLVAACSDNIIKIWDLTTLTLIQNIQIGDQNIISLKLSPDTAQIVFSNRSNEVQVWDRYKEALIQKFNLSSDIITQVAIFKNNTVYCAGADKTIKSFTINPFYDEVMFDAKQFQHSYPITCLATNYNMQIYATGSSDKLIRVWDYPSKQQLSVLRGHAGTIKSIVCYEVKQNNNSYPLKYLISGGDDAKILVWDLYRREIVKELVGHKDWVNSLSITPDNKFLVSGSTDKIIKIWDLEKMAIFNNLQEHTGSVKCVFISNSGNLLASGSVDRTIIVRLFREILNRQPNYKFFILKGHQDEVNSISISKDDQYLVSGSGDLTIKLWNLQNGSELHTFNGHMSDVTTVSFSDVSNYIVSGSKDKTIRIWNINSQKEVMTLNGHTEAITGIFVQESDHLILSTSMDHSIKQWKIPSLEQYQIKQLSSNPIALSILQLEAMGSQNLYYASNIGIVSNQICDNDYTMLQLLNDSKALMEWNFETKITHCQVSQINSQYIIITADEAGTLRFYAMKENLSIIALIEGNKRTITSMACGQNCLAVAYSDFTIELYKILDRQLICKLASHQAEINQLEFNNDPMEQLFSSSADKTIKLWNIEKGMQKERLIKTFQGHNDKINNFGLTKFYENSKQKMVSCSKDKTMKVWFVEEPESKLTIQSQADDEFRLAQYIGYDLIITAGGQADNNLKLWNGQTGQLLRQLQNFHKGIITKMLIGLSNHLIITLGEDNKMVARYAEFGSIEDFQQPNGYKDVVMQNIQQRCFKFNCKGTFFDKFLGMTEGEKKLVISIM